jgi:hypothetical protein
MPRYASDAKMARINAEVDKAMAAIAEDIQDAGLPLTDEMRHEIRSGAAADGKRHGGTTATTDWRDNEAAR